MSVRALWMGITPRGRSFPDAAKPVEQDHSRATGRARTQRLVLAGKTVKQLVPVTKRASVSSGHVQFMETIPSGLSLLSVVPHVAQASRLDKGLVLIRVPSLEGISV